MYEFILSTKLLTAAGALALAAIASGLVGHGRLWWRGMLFTLGPMLAAAFFLIAPLAPVTPDLFDLLGGLLFEFTILCLFFHFFGRLLAVVHRMADADALALLRTSLILQLMVAWPIVTSEGFGLLSEGSRIDYLYGSSLAKYFTYTGMVLTTLQTGLIAQRISRNGNPGWLGVVTIFINFALSVAAGSKGAAFLWLSAVLAMVDYRQARISTRAALTGVVVLMVALVVSSNLVADFLGITTDEFANLAVSRFFLNNDARALAFDLRTSTSPDAGLLAESLRSVFSLLGSPPVNPPLGVHLYGEYFGISDGSGANAALAALITFYSPAGYAMVPAIGATCFALLLFVVVRIVQSAMRRASSQFIVLTFGIFALLQLSQDFLAFQVVMPLACIGITFVWIFDRRYAYPNRARLRNSSDASAHQYRHPLA